VLVVLTRLKKLFVILTTSFWFTVAECGSASITTTCIGASTCMMACNTLLFVELNVLVAFVVGIVLAARLVLEVLVVLLVPVVPNGAVGSGGAGGASNITLTRSNLLKLRKLSRGVIKTC